MIIFITLYVISTIKVVNQEYKLLLRLLQKYTARSIYIVNSDFNLCDNDDYWNHGCDLIEDVSLIPSPPGKMDILWERPILESIT